MPLPMNRALQTAFLVVTMALGSGLPAWSAERGSPRVLAQVFDDDSAGAPVEAPGNSAALSVRIDRMENTIRSLTGQIEELQFKNRKLTDDLRKVQQDTEFRFQDLERGGTKSPLPRRSDAGVAPPALAGAPQDASGVDPAVPDAGAAPARPVRRAGDAFDPDSNPTAPGAPRPLGSTPPSPPLQSHRDQTASAQPNAPLELMKRPATPPEDQSTEYGVAAVPPGATPEVAMPPRPAPNAGTVASLAPGGTRDEYNADLDLYRQGQYDAAASGLKGFLDKYPRDRMVPDAVYLLGDTYAKMGRHREAAEQYLRLSTDYSKAPRAPDALLKLGIALNAMGVHEQACATYQEVTRRFPTASADLRTKVDSEIKRARC